MVKNENERMQKAIQDGRNLDVPQNKTKQIVDSIHQKDNDFNQLHKSVKIAQ